MLRLLFSYSCRIRWLLFKLTAYYIAFYVIYISFMASSRDYSKEARRKYNSGDSYEQVLLRDPFVAYKELGKKDWHNYSAMQYEALREGPGEGGKPVIVSSNQETAAIIDELYKANGFNAYASDMIDIRRSVSDIRPQQCYNMTYLEKLPSVSIIFPFYNEHNSTLLRSIYSVIDRSPEAILKEIILVDDGSTKPFLKEPLEKFLKDTGLDRIVTIVRSTQREGLIRARLLGARHATGEILVFLDSHSEANYNWLPPLIEPIIFNYRTAVCPFVDVIDCDDFKYRAQDDGARGSFDWRLNYKRLPLLRRDSVHSTRPFESPVMAGGYFAISRDWFWELGGYDEELRIWGGEQYELSFKIWQCHGRIVDAPCSHVGHIYKCKYSPFANAGIGDYISRNYKRVAEVWMDEYKYKLYSRRSMMVEIDEGDLSMPKAVRKRLKCKSFDWYMKNVAFDQDEYFPFQEPPWSAEGKIRLIDSNKCIDSMHGGVKYYIALKDCDSFGNNSRSEQKFRLGHRLDIRPINRDVCFDIEYNSLGARIILITCYGILGSQRFDYRPETQQIFHPISGFCVEGSISSGRIIVNKCDTSNKAQKWSWTKLNHKMIQKRNAITVPNIFAELGLKLENGKVVKL